MSCGLACWTGVWLFLVSPGSLKLSACACMCVCVYARARVCGEREREKESQKVAGVN